LNSSYGSDGSDPLSRINKPSLIFTYDYLEKSMITFYTYIFSDRFKTAYHYGNNEIKIDEWIPNFKTLGECVDEISSEKGLRLDEVIVLELESLTFKVKKKLKFNLV
jgi:hypothetical protein